MEALSRKTGVHHSDRSQITVIPHRAEFAFRHAKKSHDTTDGPAIQNCIQKREDNVAADALSRVAHLQALQAVSMLRPDWIQEVLNSFATDSKAHQLLTQLAITSPNAAGYTL